VVRWSICAEKVIQELENMSVLRWFNFGNGKNRRGKIDAVSVRL